MMNDISSSFVQPPAPALFFSNQSLNHLQQLGSNQAWPERLTQSIELLQQAEKASREPILCLRSLSAIVRELDYIFIAGLPALQAAASGGDKAAGEIAHTASGYMTLLLNEVFRLFHTYVLAGLAQQGLQIVRVEPLDVEDQGWLHTYFRQRVYPLLTPLAVDPGHPFPHISSDSLNLLVELRRPIDGSRESAPLFARVKVPPSTPWLIQLPRRLPAAATAAESHTEGVSDAQPYVLGGDVVRAFVHDLFPEMPIRQVYFFRVLRANTPLPRPILGSEGRSHPQEHRPVVHLDVENRMPQGILRWLADHLRVPGYGIVRSQSPLTLASLPRLADYITGQERTG